MRAPAAHVRMFWGTADGSFREPPLVGLTAYPQAPFLLAAPKMRVRGTPPSAIVYAVPEFIWGMSANVKE